MLPADLFRAPGRPGGVKGVVTSSRRTTLGGLLTLVLFGASGGCDSARGEAPIEDGRLQGRIAITGSSTVAPLVGEIARRFEEEYPAVRIDVQTGGTSRGIADVRREIAEIGMVSRVLRPEEADLLNHAIAVDGIAFIVHSKNPVPALTHEEIVGIFTGETRRWSEVGGGHREITIVNKADGRATLELFLSHFELRGEEVRPSVIIGDNQQGIRTVATSPDAVAYVSIGTASFESSRGTAIRLLPVDGVDPTLEALRDGTYPLTRPLNLVSRADSNLLVEAFLAYVASAEVHDLVEAQYFVPPVE